MERVYPSDFNMSENTSQESFVRVSEINDMIAYGVFKLDRNKLKEYKFDTTIIYNKERYTREEAMNLFGSLIQKNEVTKNEYGKSKKSVKIYML